MPKRKSFSIFPLLLAGCCLLTGIRLSARSWKDISRSGTLKVLILEADRVPSATFGLHRMEMPIDRQQAVLRKFARENKLKVEFLSAPGFQTLFAMLEMGQGDLIASSLAETPERKKRYLLTIPFFYTREIVFSAADSSLKGSNASALKGKLGRVLPGTTYSDNLRALAAKNKAVRFQDLKESLSHEELIELVASGKIDYSVLNECDLDAWLTYRKDIRKLFPLRRRVPMVFAANKNDTMLISKLNKFISKYSPVYKKNQKQKTESAPSGANAAKTAKKEKAPGTPSGKQAEEKEIPAVSSEDAQTTSQLVSSRMVDDLEAIRERGYIRMLTSNNAFCCYLQRGELCGFEYELATRFAEALDVAVVTVIPEKFQDLTRYLEEGKGDFIAANYTFSSERIKAHPELNFCSPYFPMHQVLVGRPGEKAKKVSDLDGRKIHVRRGSTYWDTLQKLQKEGAQFQIVTVPEEQQSLSILRDVASGKYDLTLVDESFLQLALSAGCKVKELMTVGDKQSYSWVVRKNNPKLAAAVNAFFKKENRSAFFNLCKKRYFSPRTAREVAPTVFKDKQLVISPYDALFKKYGKLYNFHWYFLAAQAFQESRFQTDRVNHLGAAGLMQVLPVAAKEVGVSDLTKPENGICAGTRYLAKLRKRFAGQMTPEDQLCFALASYNAGYGHVQDARRLAVKMKLDPNVWYGNTEQALIMLEEPKYYSRTKFGYCRAVETIPYVQNIMFYTYHYRQMLELDADRQQKLAAPQKP